MYPAVGAISSAGVPPLGEYPRANALRGVLICPRSVHGAGIDNHPGRALQVQEALTTPALHGSAGFSFAPHIWPKAAFHYGDHTCAATTG